MESSNLGQFESREMVYLANGFRYKFVKVHKENGVLRGWCQAMFSWAWLTDDRIQFDDCLAVPAERILG